jgi:CheY-like chemotaxis protein
MNGKALADRFRDYRPEIKVLFASGYTDKAIVQQGLLNNEVAFIQKPFSMLELTQKVRSVLDG